MDHKFWRVTLQMEDHLFACILEYIRKGRNNKFFNNIDVDPRDTLRQKRNHCFELRHKLQLYKGLPKVE